MSSVLDQVEWGKPALSLLSQCNHLDPNLPAVMHVRHTERFIPQSLDGIQIPLTETGKNAAYEFGTNLLSGRAYRLHHNNVDRTKETTEQIHQGISDKNGKAQIMDIVDLQFIHDVEKTLYYIEQDTLENRTLKKPHSFFFKWVSGRYPPKELKPSLEFAQQGAALTIHNLQSADSDTMDIYVSHDVWVASFLLHWFGIIPFDYIDYLDGFIMQLTKEKTYVYYRGERIEVVLPYWWDFTS